MDTNQTKTKLIGYGFSILENVDPNPDNFVSAGVVHTRSAQIGCLLRLEPNLQAHVSYCFLAVRGCPKTFKCYGTFLGFCLRQKSIAIRQVGRVLPNFFIPLTFPFFILPDVSPDSSHEQGLCLPAHLLRAGRTVLNRAKKTCLHTQKVFFFFGRGLYRRAWKRLLDTLSIFFVGIMKERERENEIQSLSGERRRR